jgi:hypothetical protein
MLVTATQIKHVLVIPVFAVVMGKLPALLVATHTLNVHVIRANVHVMDM